MRGSVLGLLVSTELDVNIRNFCVCGWMLFLLFYIPQCVAYDIQWQPYERDINYRVNRTVRHTGHIESVHC